MVSPESKMTLSPSIRARFDSLVGIKRSERTIFAIGKLNSHKQDFLVRILKVNPKFFDKTIDHMQRCSRITHPNVQKFHLIADPDSCCIYLLFEPDYTILERIEEERLFTKEELPIFLSHIQLGLAAQKAALNSENSFLDEWNIFQTSNRFTVGPSLPFEGSKCLLPLDENFEGLKCQHYKPLIEPELGKLSENSSRDAYFLGVLALKLIARGKSIMRAVNENSNMFEAAVTEILNGSKEDYDDSESISTLNSLLFKNQMILPVKIDKPMAVDPSKLKSNVALPVFDSFRNGDDISTDNFPNAGHHGEF